MSVMQELRRLADFASNDQLEHILQCGSMPDPEELSGYEYNGWNTALPFKLGPKFRKGFQQQDGGRFTGYNVNMKLDLLSLKPNCQPWEPVDGLLSAERFGFYDVKLPGQDPVCDAYPNALVLDYNCGLNPPPLSWTKDYLVEVNKNDPSLLLGKFYLHPFSFNTDLIRFDNKFCFSPNYFILAKERKLPNILDGMIKDKYYRNKK